MPKDKRIVATSITADKPTPSLNIYSREILERLIREFNVRARKRPVKGSILNQDAIYELGEVSHATRRLFIDDSGTLCAEIEIIDSPEGKKLLNMINENIIVARPIMCIPAYIDEIKKQSHGPTSITDIKSIVRIQVQNAKPTDSDK